MKCAGRQILSAIMALALLAASVTLPGGLASISVLGASNGPDNPVILGFSQLPDEVATQSYSPEAAPERQDLNLPATLEAEIQGDGWRALEIPSWNCAPEYKQELGAYTFTPALPEGYATADGVEPPTVVVRIGQLMTMSQTDIFAVTNVNGSLQKLQQNLNQGMDLNLVFYGISTYNWTEKLTVPDGRKLVIWSTSPIEIRFSGDGHIELGDVSFLEVGGDKGEDITMTGNNRTYPQAMIHAPQNNFGGQITIHSNATLKDWISSSTSGGAIFSRSTSITHKGKIINCQTAGEGGGIYALYARLTVEGGTITNCFAGQSGGAISSNVTISINGGTITDNQADLFGGGVKSNAGLWMIGGTITNNNASLGKDVYFRYPSANFRGNVVIGSLYSESPVNFLNSTNFTGSLHFEIPEYAAENVKKVLLMKAREDRDPIANGVKITYEDSSYTVSSSNGMVYALSEFTQYPITYHNITAQEAKNNPNPAQYIYMMGVEEFKDLPNRADADFIGWYTAPQGGDQVTAFDGQSRGALELYARWLSKGAPSHTITYVDPRNATNPNPASYRQGQGLVLQPLTSRGYEFLGWYNAETGGSKVDRITDTDSGPKTLYARWETDAAWIYAITYVDPLNAPNPNPGTYHAADGLVLQPLAYKGKAFGGWYDAATGGNRVERITGVTGDITLYARWHKETVIINFHNLPAGVSPGMPTTYTGSDQTVTLLPPTPELDSHGRHFLGWYTAAEGGTKMKTISLSSDADYDVYARWGYYILGYKNMMGNAPKATSLLYTVGQELIPLPTPDDPKGYRFTGWDIEVTNAATSPNDTMTITTKDGITAYPSYGLEPGDMILTAHWEQYVRVDVVPKPDNSGLRDELDESLDEYVGSSSDGQQVLDVIIPASDLRRSAFSQRGDSKTGEPVVTVTETANGFTVELAGWYTSSQEEGQHVLVIHLKNKDDYVIPYTIKQGWILPTEDTPIPGTGGVTVVPGGSSGGSGSSGGGSARPQDSTSVQPRAVTSNEAMAAYRSALPGAQGGTVTVSLSGWFSELPLAVQQALAKQAQADGVRVTLQINQVQNRATVARLTFNPAQANAKVMLTASCTSADAVNRASSFRQWFASRLLVVATGQAGAYGQPVEIAIKPDLAGMDTQKLVFYSYDKVAHTYRRIEKPNYRLDKNGYLHFTTEMSGDIIISEDALVKK